ncbi:sugar transferase [uncultured Ruminococcus sp.]|uniref:sugar transferase n=1 Tax=uncultured Ruminococcus sp. TaxID=165186 RepID=UPI0025ED783A|nr:sugar transferase [uncultured Ruminococcus sp.]
MKKSNFDTAKVTSKYVKNKPVYDFVKRFADILCSTIAIILLSPFFIIISIAIKATSKGPVIFIHKRVGKNGKEIGIYKFRSMVMNAEELIEKFTPEQKEEFQKNFKLENDPRITKIGKILRKTSLDELPQLFNILKGDLSIVGPRPIMEVETEIYGKYKDMLLSVKPGLTGFWAANGRSDTSYKRRRAMEIYYVKNRSLLFDINIILKTVISVFKGEGAK